jgi:hypothetical protein
VASTTVKSAYSEHLTLSGVDLVWGPELVEADIEARRGIGRSGLILLKNSSLIGRLFSDSIALLIGRIGDDGTEAGSTGGAVL